MCAYLRLVRAACLLSVIVAGIGSFTGKALGDTFVVDQTSDYTDDNPGDGVCLSAFAGGCTLRAAIEEANALAGPDRIHFDIGGGPGVKTIRPSFITIVGPPEDIKGLGLPAIREELTIDGWTQGGPGYDGPPLIEIDGTLVHLADAGFYITAGSSSLRGLIVNGFSDHAAIQLTKRGDNVIQGCYVGTDETGTQERRNDVGILVESAGNTIGGLRPAHRNIVSGNSTGILVQGAAADRSSILGNFIGTTVDGDAGLPNEETGIGIYDEASQTQVGSDDPNGRNVISKNNVGIFIINSSRTVIHGNLIGTDPSGRHDLGNRTAGVAIFGGSDSRVGTIREGEGNTIAFNRVGVLVSDVLGASATGNSIRGNSISSSSELGIELVPVGPTRNDPLDADTGPNGLQNFPELSRVTTARNDTVVEGELHSLPATAFFVDFYSSSDCGSSCKGSGEVYLQSIAIETDDDGNASFKVRLEGAQRIGAFITATAVRQDTLDTSELSAPRVVTEAGGLQVPGDCNQDGRLDISDASCLVGFLFQGAPARLPCGNGSATDRGNIALTDWQPDSRLDLSDAVGLVTFLFNGGASHPLAVVGHETRGCVLIPGCPDNAVCANGSHAEP